VDGGVGAHPAPDDQIMVMRHKDLAAFSVILLRGIAPLNSPHLRLK